MHSKNKTVVDTDLIVDEMENKCESSIKNFEQYLSRTLPNKIDMMKLRAMYVGIQKISDLEKQGDLYLIPSGTKSVHIQFNEPNHSQNIARKITAAAIENDYSVREQDFMLIISMKSTTEESRKQIITQIKNEKEKCKQYINHQRNNAQKNIKDLAEDQKKQISKKIDNIKDKMMSAMEGMFKRKEKEILV